MLWNAIREKPRSGCSGISEEAWLRPVTIGGKEGMWPANGEEEEANGYERTPGFKDSHHSRKPSPLSP
jgi:hypothetical protein